MGNLSKCYKLIDLRKILNERVKCYEEKYGKSDKTIETFYNTKENGYWDLINECRLYIEAKQLVITTPLVLYSIPFARIIGYDIIDVNGNHSIPLITASTTVTKTDTGDMIKRAIIGGIVAGGIGAVVGASTAKKTTTSKLSEVDEYRNLIRMNTNSTNLALIIKTDDISSPTLKIPFDMFRKEAEELAASLNTIINQNANTTETDDSIISTETAKLVSVGRKMGIEPTDPFKKYEEEYQKKMQEEREKRARKEKWEAIGGWIWIIMIVGLCIWACCVSN